MKRVLSLVLALVLVLGMIPTFAADMTAGQHLFEHEFIAGDGMGNLNEDQLLTREQLAKLVLELNGSKDEAEVLTLPPSYLDAAKISAWARPFVAYAQIEGLMKGYTDNTFRPQVGVSGQQLAQVLTRALGYEFPWATVVADAADLGIEVSTNAALTRGEAFEAMWVTVNTVPEGEELPLGVLLGKIEAPAPETVALNVKAVSVVNGTVVDVTLNAAATSADVEAAEISIVNASNAALAVNSFELSEDGKTVTLFTAAQTTAAKYTLKINGTDYVFIGGVADTAAPSAITAVAVDNTTVDVTFTDASSRLDKMSAENVANYSIPGLTVQAAELSGKVVTLTTSAQTSGSVYTVSVLGVKDVAGNAITSAKTASFAGKLADTAAPSAITVVPYSNTKVIVTFTDASNIDAASASNLANYSIDKSLVVSAAELITTTDGATLYGATKNKSVVLTTSAQTAGSVYTVTVNGVADVKGNAITTAKTATFAGKAADVAAPSAVTVAPYSNTQIIVTFTDASNIDAATANVAANYTIDKGLTVASASLITSSTDATKYSATANKSVLVTTSAQTTGTVYTLSVNGVADIAGNAISTAKTATFAGKAADTTKPTIASATAGAANTVTIVFTDASLLDETTVKTLTNYSFNNNLGFPLSVNSWTAATKTLVLNTATQTNGVVYTVTVNNIADAAGNVITANSTKTFAGIGSAMDAPALSSVTALDNQRIKVVFNKDVTGVAVTDFELLKGSATTDTLADNTGESVTALSKTEYIIFLGTAAADKLVNDVYKLKVVGTVTDLGGTNLDTTATAKAHATFGGVDSAAVTPQIVNIVHKSSKQVEVQFNQEVTVSNLAAASNVTVTYPTAVTINLGGTAAATYAVVDADDATKVLFTFASPIAADKVATLTIKAADFAKFEDITGNIAMVTNGTTDYTVNFGTIEFSATTLKLSSATGVNENTIELKFNQPIVFNTGSDLTNPGAGTDNNFLVIKNDSTGAAITGYNLTYATQTSSDTVRVYLTPGANLVDGTVYRVEIADNAAGDALFATIDAVALDASVVADAKAVFGFNATEKAAPSLISVVPLSSTVLQLTFSESLSADPVQTTNLVFKNGTTTFAAGTVTLADTGTAKKVYTATLAEGVFAAGTTYTIEVVSGAITDKYGVDALKATNGTTVPHITFGGLATAPTYTIPAATNAATNDQDSLVMTFPGKVYTLSGGTLTELTNADHKAHFTKTGTVALTSGTYATATEDITWVLVGSVTGDTLAPTAATLYDAAGNAYTGTSTYNTTGTIWTK